jgi:hypothetical protein
MIDIQAMMDMSQRLMRESRSRYHLTLGQLIQRLEKLPKKQPIQLADGRGIEGLDSYRGYYCDMALHPVDGPVWNAGQLLRECRRVLDTKLTGYKGGEFLMDRATPLWVAEHGSAVPEAVMDLLADGTLVIRDLEALDD